MKNPIVSGILIFFLALSGCGNNNSQETDKNVPGHVKKYSGDEITPQVKIDSDSTSRLKIDTITSAESANQRKD